jgi:hypothetical protein
MVFLVYQEGKSNNDLILLIQLCYFSTGLPGRDGIDGRKGDRGHRGLPGRKVRSIFMLNKKLFEDISKGNQGAKGEVGDIQKVDFNSTHIILMGPSGLPGRRVRYNFMKFCNFFVRERSVYLANRDYMEKKVIKENPVQWYFKREHISRRISLLFLGIKRRYWITWFEGWFLIFDV